MLQKPVLTFLLVFASVYNPTLSADSTKSVSNRSAYENWLEAVKNTKPNRKLANNEFSKHIVSPEVFYQTLLIAEIFALKQSDSAKWIDIENRKKSNFQSFIPYVQVIRRENGHKLLFTVIFMGILDR